MKDKLLAWTAVAALGVKPKYNGDWWEVCYQESYSGEYHTIVGIGQTVEEAVLDFYNALTSTKTENE